MPHKDPDKRRAYEAQYWKNHGKQHAANIKRYRKKFPEKASAISKKYHKDHIEKDRAYILANPEQIKATQERYRRTHPERVKASYATYAKANSEKIRAKCAKRRARKAGAPINDLTAAQWQEIKTAYGHRCVYCERKMQRLTQDHITPLSKGGSHTLSNIVPACTTCNSRKHVNGPLAPVQPLLVAIAPPSKRVRLASPMP